MKYKQAPSCVFEIEIGPSWKVWYATPAQPMRRLYRTLAVALPSESEIGYRWDFGRRRLH